MKRPTLLILSIVAVFMFGVPLFQAHSDTVVTPITLEKWCAAHNGTIGCSRAPPDRFARTYVTYNAHYRMEQSILAYLLPQLEEP